jgi:hypothetical protein
VTKLKEVAFRSRKFFTTWITKALRTITSEHRNLRLISIYNASIYNSFPHSSPNITAGWLDLDRILVQLWESHTVRTKIHTSGKEDGEVCEFISGLLPETTKRGIIELVDYSDLRWG